MAFGLALIPGYRLLFKKSKTGSYATIEQDANCCVPALVYKISEYDETLLNRYEGYPKYYYKRYFQLPICSCFLSNRGTIRLVIMRAGGREVSHCILKQRIPLNLP